MAENLRTRLGKMVTITWEDGKTARVRAKWHPGPFLGCYPHGYLAVYDAQIQRAEKRVGATGARYLRSVDGWRIWLRSALYGFYIADKIQE